MNEVNHNICLDVFQCLVHVSNMSTAFLHKVVLVCIVYKNNNLLPEYILGSHVDSRFRLAITFDYALNIVDVLFVLKVEKASLILRTFLILLLTLEACMYNISQLLFT